MSTQTEHLGLHQWEPSDPFLRTDFNEDFAKIDAETGVLRTFMETSSAAGAYTCAYDTAMEIPLGFRPKLLVLLSGSPSDLALMVDDGANGYGRSVYGDQSGWGHLGGPYGVSLTDGGFAVNAKATNYNDTKGKKVYYAAFR